MAAKKKTTSTGSPTLDAANAAKKFKAPKGYKPLTTAQKVGMVASAIPAGRVVGTAAKAANAVVKSTKTFKTVSLNKSAKAYDKATAKSAGYKATTAAEKRAIKAAKKPTNKVGSKADRKLRSETKSVQLSKEDTKAQYDYYYGKGSGDDITQINKRVTPKNEARSVRNFKKR